MERERERTAERERREVADDVRRKVKVFIFTSKPFQP